MPPWIYSDGFWGNLWEVMFPHQWLAELTVGKDLAKTLNGAAVAGGVADETAHDNVSRDAAPGSKHLDSGASGSISASAGLTAATDPAASQVRRRHGRKVA
jgi:hypothetical protein